MSVRGVLSFVFGAVAAYSLSFGLDLLVASATGYYSTRPYGAGLLWASMGALFHVVARRISTSKYPVVIPYSLFGGLAVLSGVIGPHRFNVLVGLPLIVVATLYARQGTTGGSAPQATSFPIGAYALGASIQGIKGLVEFSPQEYALMPREFKGGANFNAPPAMFLGRSWKMSIGAAIGHIY